MLVLRHRDKVEQSPKGAVRRALEASSKGIADPWAEACQCPVQPIRLWAVTLLLYQDIQEIISGPNGKELANSVQDLCLLRFKSAAHPKRILNQFTDLLGREQVIPRLFD